jgi:multicomponent Na+:H+ antiporter subunit A
VPVEVNSDIVLLLVVFAPFLAAALAPAVHRALGAWSGWVLALVPAASTWQLWDLVPQVAGGDPVSATVKWGSAHGLSLSLQLDGLGLLFSLTIAAVGTFIFIYSGPYLRGHRHQGRFLCFMMMFMGAMQGLVLADGLLVLYVFWELTTVASFLLIGFDHARQRARRAAIQAVVVTGVGGLALLAASVLLQRLTGTWNLSELTAPVHDLSSQPAYTLVLVLVLVAAFTKSAQVPFHFWLPNAMEAPTPVSAFLHSATMVQGGVYLLARLSPALGGTSLWTGALVLFGGVTLLWGGIAALRQTDMKMMLAQTTVASLGLLVLLLGIGTPLAVAAAVLYFLAHALYKAGLFLVTGIVDHATGTRDLTALGGLRDSLTVTFLAAIALGASMLGLPPLLGYFAKDEMYLGLVSGAPADIVLLAVLVVGNALLGAVALTIALRPFMGGAIRTPRDPHEASLGLLAGPVVLGMAGALALSAAARLAEAVLGPAATAVAGAPVEFHLEAGLDLAGVVFWLSLLTWLLSGLVYWRLDALRTLLGRGPQSVLRWTFDQGFDQWMFGLIRGAAAVTRLVQHGRLELYLVVVFAMLALALTVPIWLLGGIPEELPRLPAPSFYEWAILGVTALGVLSVLWARTRLFAIVALGIQGLGVAVIFLLAGAPDLSFTQFMVEALSVVILALVMTRLQLERQDPRELEDLLRDGAIALVCGTGVSVLLLAVLAGALDPRLGDFFNANSVPLAHGRNVVNVILVDFRGLDTLGEICVVMTAGIAMVVLLRRRKQAVT